MGVNIIEMKTPLETELVETEDFVFGPVGQIGADAKTYLFERRYNNSFALLNELLKNKVEVYWSDAEFTVQNKKYPAGTFIVPGKSGAAPRLKTLSEKFSVPVYGVSEAPRVKKTQALLPRLGIYHPWTANKDEGWTRLVLDNFKYSYKQLYNKEIKQGKLAGKYDAVIIPDASIAAIVDGKRRWRSSSFVGSPKKPEKYRGGIGREGIEALTAFVKAGGTLICLGEASDFAIEKLHLPAKNVLKDVKRKDFYAPGSLLEIELDLSQPLAYGMPRQTAVRLSGSPTFRLLSHIRESKAVGYYNQENPLLSGWLVGAEKLAARTALAEIPVEKGRVILFGFRVQSRAQTFGTFKLLFNAINTSRGAVPPAYKGLSSDR